jgi:hypothetical protein
MGAVAEASQHCICICISTQAKECAFDMCTRCKTHGSHDSVRSLIEIQCDLAPMAATCVNFTLLPNRYLLAWLGHNPSTRREFLLSTGLRGCLEPTKPACTCQHTPIVLLQDDNCCC